MKSDNYSENGKDAKLSTSFLEALDKIDRRMIRRDPEAVREVLDSLEMEDRVRLVMHFSGRDRRDLIYISEESEAIVKAMPPPELWLTIKDIGEEDSIDLIRMATPGQMRHFADLEWWHKDTLDPLAVAYWLMLIKEAGPLALMGYIKKADEELLVSSFARFFNVFKTDPDDEGNEPWRELDNLWTLDDVYYLQFPDPNLAPLLEEVLHVVREMEPMLYYGLLDAVELLPTLEQEHEAYRLRTARLMDYGFVDFDESLEIYAPLPGREMAALEKEAPEPREMYFPEPASRFPIVQEDIPELLARAMSIIEDPTVIEDLSLGMGALTNRILIADSMDLSKVENVKAALTKARNFVEMGLSRWSEDNVEKAAHLLRTQHPVIIFRAGYTSVIMLARDAHSFSVHGWLNGLGLDMSVLGDDGMIIKGLMKARPMFYRGADNQGSPVYGEFGEAGEVERAKKALNRSRAAGLLLVEGLGIEKGDLDLLASAYSGAELSLTPILVTAVLNVFAGKGMAFEPIRTAEAKEALSILLTGERPRIVDPSAALQVEKKVGEIVSSLGGAGPDDVDNAKNFVMESIRKLELEVKELDPEYIDPRYIKTIILSG